MIKLITTGNETQAVLLKGQLEKEGISAIITTSNESYSPGILGIHNGPVPYEVYVSESDLERAKEIVDQSPLDVSSEKEAVERELRHEEDTLYP